MPSKREPAGELDLLWIIDLSAYNAERRLLPSCVPGSQTAHGYIINSLRPIKSNDNALTNRYGHTQREVPICIALAPEAHCLGETRCRRHRPVVLQCCGVKPLVDAGLGRTRFLFGIRRDDIRTRTPSERIGLVRSSG